MEFPRSNVNFPQQRVPYSQKQKAEWYANCIDYVIDMGPGGGEVGGRLVACGTPEQIKNAADSVTGKFI